MLILYFIIFYYIFILIYLRGLGIGDWGLPNPQSPIPNPQSPILKDSNLNY